MEDINAHHIILVNVLNEQTKPNLTYFKIRHFMLFAVHKRNFRNLKDNGEKLMEDKLVKGSLFTNHSWVYSMLLDSSGWLVTEIIINQVWTTVSSVLREVDIGGGCKYHDVGDGNFSP